MSPLRQKLIDYHSIDSALADLSIPVRGEKPVART